DILTRVVSEDAAANHTVGARADIGGVVDEDSLCSKRVSERQHRGFGPSPAATRTIILGHRVREPSDNMDEDGCKLRRLYRRCNIHISCDAVQILMTDQLYLRAISRVPYLECAPLAQPPVAPEPQRLALAQHAVPGRTCSHFGDIMRNGFLLGS